MRGCGGMADAADSKSAGGDLVRVRVPPSPEKSKFRNLRKVISELAFLLTRKFPYWFSENYCASSHDPYDLPYDQHYLLASIAPRYVLVGSASENLWADPLSQFLCTVAATPAFERAGVEGLVCEDEIPGDDATLLDGHIGYHCRPGKHYFSRTDWHRFMEFIRRHSL